MNQIEQAFLRILKAALQGQRLTEYDDFTLDQWQAVFQLAQAHKVLPMVYQTVYQAPALKDSGVIRATVRKLVVSQTMKTEEFLQLNKQLKNAGCTPLVVKGLVCRNLYPQPDLRASSDEDLLIPQEQFGLCCQILRQFGMQTSTPESRMETDFEVPFRKQDGVLFIELHKRLFPPDSDAYGHWNSYFADVFQNAIQDGEVLTLSYTDHLFYLICHAFKHFVHSGFGIRQVCDIGMFANAYGQLVDWGEIHRNCCQIHAEVFAAAIFQIGKNYLGFDPDKAAYPQVWREISVDETDMLLDLLSAGVYGSATLSRQHSSNMTLSAVSGDRKGRGSLRRMLFPSAKSLETRYPYLQKHPILLPVAWSGRIVGYLRQTKYTQNNSIQESLEIGNQRVALLRKYRVIR